MLARRTLLASPALLVKADAAVRPLAWHELPVNARLIAPDLGLRRETWEQWQSAQRRRTALRVQQGTAEHIFYYALQSRSFTDAPPLDPMRVAAEHAGAWPPGAEARLRAFAKTEPKCDRHRLLREIWDSAAWPLDRCYQHAVAFLRAKEIDQQPLDALYEQRGFSSDTQPASSKLIEKLGDPRRILLAGPGLDFTRREKFDDALPLRSYQLERLRELYPKAAIDAVDIRPEVVRHLNVRQADLTVDRASGAYDVIIATNILLYFPPRELFTALAGLALALAPGGRLLHNDQRFAAKVFGEAHGLTMERFEPLQFASRQGIEQWDRIVTHRKGAAH